MATGSSEVEVMVTLRTISTKGGCRAKGVQQRTGGWERRIVDMSQHSSFVGLAVRWSREAGLMEDMTLQGGGGWGGEEDGGSVAL